MPRRVIQEGQDPYYLVKVGFHGFFLSFATRNEPDVKIENTMDLLKKAVVLEGPQYSDTLGYIDDNAVVSITWRQVTK